MNGFFRIRPVFFNKPPTFESSFFGCAETGFLTSGFVVVREPVDAGLAAADVAEARLGFASVFPALTFASRAGSELSSSGEAVTTGSTTTEGEADSDAMGVTADVGRSEPMIRVAAAVRRKLLERNFTGEVVVALLAGGYDVGS